MSERWPLPLTHDRGGYEDQPSWAEDELQKKRERLKDVEVDLASAKLSLEPVILGRRRAAFIDRVKQLVLFTGNDPNTALVAQGQLREAIAIFDSPQAIIAEHKRLKEEIEEAVARKS